MDDMKKTQIKPMLVDSLLASRDVIFAVKCLLLGVALGVIAKAIGLYY